MLVKPGVKRKKKTDIWSVAAPQQEQYMISRYRSKIRRYLHIQKCSWISRYTNKLNAIFFDNANSEILIRPFNSNLNGAGKQSREYYALIFDGYYGRTQSESIIFHCFLKQRQTGWSNAVKVDTYCRDKFAWRFSVLRSNAEIMIWRHYQFICLQLHQRLYRGCNNKVKVLKRNVYGYRNFRRFRNRIPHIFSHQKLSADSWSEPADAIFCFSYPNYWHRSVFRHRRRFSGFTTDFAACR